MKIKIAVAEDNIFLFESIKDKMSLFPDFSLKFRGENGRDLLDKLQSNHNIDLVLMDIQMPEMDGIEATKVIKTKYPQVKIVMLTIFDSDDYIFKAIQAGADGYLLKETTPDALHKGIIDVLEGGAAMTPSIALRTLHLLRSPETIEQKKDTKDFQLTKRETEILEQLSKGLNYHQIADNLIISPATVRKHIENCYKKLQVHNKMEAVQKGIKHNLI